MNNAILNTHGVHVLSNTTQMASKAGLQGQRYTELQPTELFFVMLDQAGCQFKNKLIFVIADQVGSVLID